MKITRFKTFVVGNPPPHRGGRNWVFLKLYTDDGIEGVGEAFAVPFDPRAVAHLLEDVCERLVMGADPFRIEHLWRTLYAAGYAEHPDLTTQGVLSAVEMACWDIVGKALNQPEYNLLGGRVHDKLRAYTYLFAGSPGEANPQTHAERAAARAAYYVEQGFTAVKFDPVGFFVTAPGQLSLEILRNVETVTKAVREAVGDQCDILVGTHGNARQSNAGIPAKTESLPIPFPSANTG